MAEHLPCLSESVFVDFVMCASRLSSAGRGAAFGDLFNDGRVDVVVENLDGKPMVLRDVSGNHNHWIGFELAGTKSNRMALNARVKAIAGDLVQVDEVRSGGSISRRTICESISGWDHTIDWTVSKYSGRRGKPIR